MREQCDWAIDQIIFYPELSLFSEEDTKEGVYAGSEKERNVTKIYFKSILF